MKCIFWSPDILMVFSRCCQSFTYICRISSLLSKHCEALNARWGDWQHSTHKFFLPTAHHLHVCTRTWNTHYVIISHNCPDLIKEEIFITVKQTDTTGWVECRSADHLHTVSPLKVRLDHLIVLAVTQGEGFQLRAPEPENVSKCGG